MVNFLSLSVIGKRRFWGWSAKQSEKIEGPEFSEMDYASVVAVRIWGDQFVEVDELWLLALVRLPVRWFQSR